MKYFLNYSLLLATLALSLIVLSACKKDEGIKETEEVIEFPLFDYSLIAKQERDEILNAKTIDYGFIRALNTNIINSGVTPPPNDPLLKYQWHLYNRGQELDYLSVNGLIKSRYNVESGHDINVEDVHNANPKIRGEGIVINIADTSIEDMHEDLRIDTVNSYKFVITNADINPYHEFHATLVGGIAAAKSGNKVGGVGVAPAATIINHNIIEAPYSRSLSLGVQYDAYQYQGSKIADVVNMSFGEGNGIRIPRSFYEYSHMIAEHGKGVFNERKRKGVVLGYNFVKAAGNGATKNGIDDCTPLYDMACEDSNQHFLNTIKYQVVVGSSSDDGKVASYSTRGANLFINAPAGESSLSQYLDAKKNPQLHKPALIAPDLMGCYRGVSKDGIYKTIIKDGIKAAIVPQNNFESDFAFENYFVGKVVGAKKVKRTTDNHHLLNPTCSYTSRANGTSSAAPIVSGVIALLLDKKPELTWRDVRYILAHSATKNDPNHAGKYLKYTKTTTTSTATPAVAVDSFTITAGAKADVNTDTIKTYQVLPGWITNAGTSSVRFNFNNLYGFGRIDVKRAIDLIDSFPTMPAEVYHESYHDSIDHDNDPNTPPIIDHDGDPSTALVIDPDPNPGRRFIESFSDVNKNNLTFTEGNLTKNTAIVKTFTDSATPPVITTKHIFPYLRDADPAKFNDVIPELWAAKHTYSKKIRTLESVTVFLDLCMDDLQTLFIRLTSPRGTKSVLLTPFTQVWEGEKVIRYTPFLSNSFYGENPLGDWYLEVFDASGKIIDKTTNPLTATACTAGYPELNKAMIHFSGMAENFHSTN
ncbi:MAG: S8 family serine peptidase [SAR324 cluster bacterium]|nr:S8 family serine peptidase [SAR324 cluster bacterium]